MGGMLTQIRILVDDFPASYRFYRDVLGLTPQDTGQSPQQQEAGPYGAFKEAGQGTDLALFDRAMMARSVGAEPGERGAADHAVIVFRVKDVDAAHAEVVGRGATSVTAPADQPGWGMRVAHVRAPEGTLIEYCSYE